jgi:hypothetical protein
MYPVELAKALLDWGIDAVAVGEQGLSDRPDSDVFAAMPLRSFTR